MLPVGRLSHLEVSRPLICDDGIRYPTDNLRPIPTAKVSAAEFFFHLGLYSEAYQLYVQGLEEAKAFFPASPKLFLALAENRVTLDWLSERDSCPNDIVKGILGFVEYGRPSQIMRLLRTVLQMGLYLQRDLILSCRAIDRIPEAILQLSKTDRRLDFLVYQSAVRVVRNLKAHRMVQSDHTDQELMHEWCSRYLIPHLRSLFLQVSPGPFELRDGVLQNDCLESCLRWCQSKAPVHEDQCSYPLFRPGGAMWIFCYFWESWHADETTKALNPWERMGLKPADLLRIITRLVLSADKDPLTPSLPEVSPAAVFGNIDILLSKPASQLAENFLDIFMSEIKWLDQENGADEQFPLHRLELGSRLVNEHLQFRTISLQNVPQTSPINTSSSHQDTTFIDAEHYDYQSQTKPRMSSLNPRLTLALSVGSSNNSMASMRRLHDRIRQGFSQSASSQRKPSSILSQMSIISGQLSILSLKSEGLIEMDEEEEIDWIAEDELVEESVQLDPIEERLEWVPAMEKEERLSANQEIFKYGSSPE